MDVRLCLLYWRQAIRDAGWQPVIYSYPTVFNRMDQNADRLWRAVQRSIKDKIPDRLHFVGQQHGWDGDFAMLRRHGRANSGKTVCPNSGAWCCAAVRSMARLRTRGATLAGGRACAG